MKKSMVKRAALGHIKRSDQSVDGGDGSYEMIRVTSMSPDNKKQEQVVNGDLVLPPKFINNSAANM